MVCQVNFCTMLLVTRPLLLHLGLSIPPRSGSMFLVKGSSTMKELEMNSQSRRSDAEGVARGGGSVRLG